jgi:hypothetical protein
MVMGRAPEPFVVMSLASVPRVQLFVGKFWAVEAEAVLRIQGSTAFNWVGKMALWLTTLEKKSTIWLYWVGSIYSNMSQMLPPFAM